MSNLVLLRHGQSYTNAGKSIDHEDQNLVTEQGIIRTIQNAKMLRRTFPDLHFTRSFVSPMPRAIQTNLNFLSAFDNNAIHSVVNEDLRERTFGFVGYLKMIDMIAQYGEDTVNSWEYDINAIPGDDTGESLLHVYNRVIDVYNTEIVPRLHAGENILITAHYYVIKVLQSHLQYGDATKTAIFNPKNCWPIVYQIGK